MRALSTVWCAAAAFVGQARAEPVEAASPRLQLSTELVEHSPAPRGWFENPAESEGEVDVRLFLAPKSRHLFPGDALEVDVEVFNQRPKALPRGTRISLKDEGSPPHFMLAAAQLKDSVSGFGNASLRLRLEPRGGVEAGFLPLPAHLRLELRPGTAGGAPLVALRVAVPFRAYSGPFEAQEGLQEIRVLLVGFPGVGKTTFVMSAASALSPHLVELPGVGGAQKHVTKRVAVYRLADYTGNRRLAVTLVDTWGITKENFGVELLELLCAGAVPHGFQMQRFQDGAIDRDWGMGRMHSVLFFLRASQSKDSGLMGRMRGYIHHLRDLGYSSRVVVTWLDGWTGAEVDKLLLDISSNVGLRLSMVLPLESYVNESTKDPLLDRSALEVLWRATRDAFTSEAAMRQELAALRVEATSTATIAAWSMALIVVAAGCWHGMQVLCTFWQDKRD